MVLAFDAHDDALGVDRIDNAVALGQDHGAGVARGDAFHARAHQRSFRDEQRNRLALHVGAHESAVGVVVLEERHQRRGHGDELLGADVDVVHIGAVDQHKVPLTARVHQIFSDFALVVELDVGLRDGVLVLFPCRQVEAERHVVDGALAFLLKLGVEARGFFLLDVIADAQAAFAGVDDFNEVENARVLHLAVRRLDEAVFIDARKAAERADEADVRTFRRLNGADAAVVRRVHVADFEAGALAGQSARSKCRQAALVRDLGERIGLIHELRKLGRSEELADGRHDGLGVDQVVRHGRRELLIDAHLFLDGALHADEADAELVLHQLADGAHAAVAEVIDVVDHADVLAQLEQVADGGVEIFRRQGAMIQVGRILALVELDVELEAAHAREVVLARVEEHAFEESGGRVECRRVTRPQLAVDFDERLFRLVDRIALERVGDDVAHVVAIGEEDFEAGCAAGQHLVQAIGGELDIGFDDHFAGVGIDNVGRGERAIEFGRLNLDLIDGRSAQRLERVRGDLAAGVRDLFAAMQHGVRGLGAHQVGAGLHILLERPIAACHRQCACGRRCRRSSESLRPNAGQERAGRWCPGTCACGRCGRRACSSGRTRTLPMSRGRE